MSKRTYNSYPAPAKICKFYPTGSKACYNENNSPEVCKHCSKNPYKNEGRFITKGQIIFLTSIGYDENEISNWDYNKACREIQRIKN